MRRVLGVLVFLVTLTVVLSACAAYWGFSVWNRPGPLDKTTELVIKRGSGAGDISQNLLYNTVLNFNGQIVFDVASRLSPYRGELKAGEYEFTPGISVHEIMDKLAKGDVIDRRVTIPEGRTSWQIVQILNKAGTMKGQITEVPKDGTLLPETYSYTRDQDRKTMIRDMQSAMQRTLSDLWPGRDAGLPFETQDQALTLASIVEKETGVAGERPRIAGVFINRLKKGMPLQSDPTVIYALTKGEMKDEGQGPLGRRLLRKDLEETDSPYNTYKYAGLPPGAIANPGRAAIEAVLHPEKNDYIYFVANGDGGHIFAATLTDHARNVAQWRKIRKEQGN